MQGFSNVDGRYRVLRLLYTRDLATTYLATDRLDGDREVLLDVAPIGDMSSDRDRDLAQLAAVVEMLKALEHPNLVAVNGFFVDGPYYGFVKPFEDGELLADRLERPEDRPTLDERIHYCRDILEGMAALHGVGLLHRDLGGRSVWLQRREGRRPVAQIDHFHRCIEAVGEVRDPLGRHYGRHPAPESLVSSSYSCQSDVYSAGVILVDLLSRSSGESGEGSEVDEAAIRREVEGAYAEALVRATHRSRLERFQDGLDFLAAFDAMDLARRLAAL